jgi:hypothetical protein
MPAVSKLRTLMLRGESHAIQLKAAESILDRAGIVAQQQVDVDNHVSITVSYQDVELAKRIVGAEGETATRSTIVYDALPEPEGNGHAEL